MRNACVDRICPGRYFALDSLFITVASVLHVFDISPPLDADGAPIPVKFEQTHGIISSVHPHFYGWVRGGGVC